MPSSAALEGVRSQSWNRGQQIAFKDLFPFVESFMSWASTLYFLSRGNCMIWSDDDIDCHWVFRMCHIQWRRVVSCVSVGSLPTSSCIIFCLWCITLSDNRTCLFIHFQASRKPFAICWTFCLMKLWFFAGHFTLTRHFVQQSKNFSSDIFKIQQTVNFMKPAFRSWFSFTKSQLHIFSKQSMKSTPRSTRVLLILKFMGWFSCCNHFYIPGGVK